MDVRPQLIRIFPLSGALLLPGGALPLHIFEKRYVRMARDALAGDRCIGMIQPGKGPQGLETVGCLGAIEEHRELADDRHLLVLRGVARFKVARELQDERPYRTVEPEWLATEVPTDASLVPDIRAAMMREVNSWLARRGASIAESADELPDIALVTSLAMALDFEPAVKQSLLEAMDLEERCMIITAAAAAAGRHGGFVN